ncbi:MAG: CHAT domain-containing protein [Bacteroidales bacterium]|nr:CHAT domain-containing protein [Bacteroidales bacterium]
MNKETDLDAMIEQLKRRLLLSDYSTGTARLHRRIMDQLSRGEDLPPLIQSDGWYYAGFYYQSETINRPDSAIHCFTESVRIKEDNEIYDENLSKAYGNLGLIHLNQEDPAMAVRYLEEGLYIRQDLFGSGHEKTLIPLLNLSAAYIDAALYEEALETALRGLSVNSVLNRPNSPESIKFYTNAGIASMRMGNYANSRNYFSVAYNSLAAGDYTDNSLMFSILNGLGVSLRFMDNNEEAARWFSKGESLYNSDFPVTRSTLSMISNYGFLLAETGDTVSALHQINSVVERAGKEYGTESPNHLWSLELLAYYYTVYGGDPGKGEEIYKRLEESLGNTPWNRVLNNTVQYGYARSLSMTGKKSEALERVNGILSDSLLSANKIKLITLTLKREILSDLYSAENDINYLMIAYNTAAEAVELYDVLRNDISSEESDIMMGSRYREVYEDCVATLHRLWKVTGDQQYLDEAFNYAEKAKASSLLASTRQLRAMNFHLPEKIARLERRLGSEINTLSELIYNERSNRYPDNGKVSSWEKMRLQTQISRDSLNRIIERDYPAYSDLKNNRGAAQYRDIRKMGGRNSDFVEFYVADSLLYVFLINKSSFHVDEIHFSKKLQDEILELRAIITSPVIETGAREQFGRFVTLAHSLYETLLGGVDDYFSTQRLIIAPDNILSYIPFEILLDREYSTGSLNYRNLPYLIDSYDILYTYSGTLLKETGKGGRSFTNRALVFAPEYRGDIPVDSLMITRQWGQRMLNPIMGAREEAVYISEMLGGELYLDSEATESRFRQRANSMPVIHLAMHTLLNDSEPMYSRMVFDFNDDGPNDGRLNTYEVYDIPVEKSKMVVLSSCNTGSGQLKTGEGVLSLARGFFYSGSPTVIMSLWEVEDQSGSDIVKLFYKNLKRGYSKSKALRKARREYLGEAVQMRSHPYFWATLVIMGDDTPIFYNLRLFSGVLVFLLLVIAGIVTYFKFRSVKAS